jgi:hypothetical protein
LLSLSIYQYRYVIDHWRSFSSGFPQQVIQLDK